MDDQSTPQLNDEALFAAFIGHPLGVAVAVVKKLEPGNYDPTSPMRGVTHLTRDVFGRSYRETLQRTRYTPPIE